MSKPPAKKTAAPAPKSADFLLDVFTEPLPARFVAPALAQLSANAEKMLAGRLPHGRVSAYGTLRHLVLLVQDAAAKGEDGVERFKGPKESAWRAADGAFTPAAEGFARKHGVEPGALKPEGGVLYAEVARKGEPAAKVFSALIPELLKSLEFPKTMTWEETGFRFGRPIRAITAVHGARVVACEVAGVKSDGLLRGHPALAAKPAALKSPAEHMKALRDRLVIADPVERRAYLLRQLELAAKSAGGFADLDEDLVAETVDMVEHPVPVVGRLRPEHMELPAALLKLVMKKQLKFFPVLDARGGLLPAFVGVRDGESAGNKLVSEGYRRVLEARFNDAAFFFGRDRKVKLADRLEGLKRVTYQKALGSMWDKAERVRALAQFVAERAGVDAKSASASAGLVYADLVTDVVREFPELQGTMGGVYARLEGLGEAAATTIEQFYWPTAGGAQLPTTPEAAAVGLAGKLDSLAGCFAAGLIPSGSADPYALRRQALGAVRIVVEKKLRVDLEACLAEALARQPARGDAKTEGALREFVWARAASYFEEKGFAVDEIRAVRRDALRDLLGASRRLAALQSARRDPSFDRIAAAFKRAANILKQSGERDERVDASALTEGAEVELSAAVESAERRVAERLGAEDYAGAFAALASVSAPLDGFFAGVMVMDPDEAVKNRRLALLTRLTRAFRRVADPSELQTTAGETPAVVSGVR